MKNFLIICAAVFVLLGMSNAYAAENFAVEVLNLVNEERAKVGVAPLSLADDLQAAANIRAREIVQSFSHTRPDGSDCFTVMQYRGRTCGESVRRNGNGKQERPGARSGRPAGKL